MNDLLKFEFQGRGIEFPQRGERPGATTKEVAAFFDVPASTIRNLHKRASERGEFKPSESWMEVVVSPKSHLDTRAAKPHAERVYDPYGVLRCGMKLDSARAVQVRDFILYEIIPAYLRMKDGRDARRVSELETALGNALADKRFAQECAETMGSLGAGILHVCKIGKRQKRDAELFTQGSLLGLTGEPLTRIDERILAALATGGPVASVAALAKKVRATAKSTGDAVAALYTRGYIQRTDGKIGIKPQSPMNGGAHVA